MLAEHLTQRLMEQMEAIEAILLRQIAAGAAPAQSFDAAHPGSHRAVRQYSDLADISRARYMGPTAQLDRIRRFAAIFQAAPAHGNNAHLITIFFAKQRQRSRLNSFLHPHQAR